MVKDIKEEKSYSLFIEANISTIDFLTNLKIAFSSANTILEKSELTYEDDVYILILNIEDDTDILAPLIKFVNSLKHYQVTRFDVCLKVCEKSSLLDYFK